MARLPDFAVARWEHAHTRLTITATGLAATSADGGPPFWGVLALFAVSGVSMLLADAKLRQALGGDA